MWPQVTYLILAVAWKEFFLQILKLLVTYFTRDDTVCWGRLLLLLIVILAIAWFMIRMMLLFIVSTVFRIVVLLLALHFF